MTSDLYDYPELYESLLPVGAHVPYYLDLAQKAAGHVLELACGTGAVSLPIARAGLSVTGLDLSAPLLELARQRAVDIPVEYVQGDMRNFELGRKFALIFIARNSLLHMHATEDILATFAMVRRHLAPGGTFAFDIFNSNLARLSRPAGPRYPVMQKETESFGTLTVEETTNYDNATQVNHARWYISAPGKPDAWVLPLALRSIYPQELLLLLAAGGFRLKSRTGDLGDIPFDSNSRSQVCQCQAV